MTLFPDLSKRSPAEQVGFTCRLSSNAGGRERGPYDSRGPLMDGQFRHSCTPQFLQEGLRTGENRRGRTEKELSGRFKGPEDCSIDDTIWFFYQDESGLTTTLDTGHAG